MPRVFISYRRDDSEPYAGRIYDRACKRFGAENVFRDVDAIAPGVKFADVIADRIANCDALFAVIGKDWLECKDGNGQRRLNDPQDWVNAEIRDALSRGKLVIPALVEGASMPKAAELPIEIAELASRNAIEISESRFDYDTERLLAVVAGSGVQYEGKRFGTLLKWISDDKRRSILALLGAAIASVAAGSWTVYQHFFSPDNSLRATPSSVVNTNSNNSTTINVGITVEQYEAGLKRRDQEVRAQIAQAGSKDSRTATQLKQELAAIEAKQNALDRSFAEYQSKVTEVVSSLETLRTDLPKDQLAQAQQALQRGDSAAAEKLLTGAMHGNEQQAAEVAFQLGQLANSRDDYVAAYDHYSKAAQLEPENSVYLNWAGVASMILARYDEAGTRLQKALEIREKSLPSDHPDLAISRINLGNLFQYQGDYTRAEALLKQALRSYDAAVDPDRWGHAIALSNLATLYVDKSSLDEALPLYDRALKISEESFGRNHREVARILKGLAGAYREKKQYSKAESLYLRAVKIYETSSRPDTLDEARCRNGLALLYEAQKQYAKAEDLYQRVLKIAQTSLGRSHPEVGFVLNSLAGLYRSQGQYDKAGPLIRGAVETVQKSLAADDPRLLIVLENYALFLEEDSQTKNEAQQLRAKTEAARRSRAEQRFPAPHELVKLADQGDAAAQLELGKRYSIGLAVPKDFVKAAGWLQKAADGRNSSATEWLADIYAEGGYGMDKDMSHATRLLQGLETSRSHALRFYYGLGVARSPSRAVDYLGHEDGNIDAAIWRGTLLSQDSEVERDYAQAVVLFESSAIKGDARGQQRLGRMFLHGLGVQRDHNRALNWLQLAANQGYALGKMNLGYLYRYGSAPDFPQAFRWTNEAALQGLPAAQHEVASMYLSGVGTQRNFYAAADWFQQAANQGYADAQNETGLNYLWGRGVWKDLLKAREWFQRAADQGNLWAYQNLGYMYIAAEGVQKDCGKGLELVNRAEAGGHVEAMNFLGTLYRIGECVEKDPATAAKWYRKGAERGFAVAMNFLAQMLATGQGVTKSESEAQEWFRRAAKLGNPDAQEELRRRFPHQ